MAQERSPEATRALTIEAMTTGESRSEDVTIAVCQLVGYAVDMWFDDLGVLTDEPRLVAALREAAVTGNAHVLNVATHVFSNGAVTAALVLSQSHFTIHTWPEHGLANVDLLAYGMLNGQAMIGRLIDTLGPAQVTATHLLRHVERPRR